MNFLPLNNAHLYALTKNNISKAHLRLADWMSENVPKRILKSPTFVPFGSDLTSLDDRKSMSP